LRWVAYGYFLAVSGLQIVAILSTSLVYLPSLFNSKSKLGLLCSSASIILCLNVALGLPNPSFTVTHAFTAAANSVE
jgi:hypothetical protein